MSTPAWENATALGRPGVVDATAARRLSRWLGAIVHCVFGPRIEGAENLPDRGPYLLVANHSGLGDAEIMAFTLAWLDRFGTERPVAGMVHPLSFHAWPQGPWLEKLGAIPSTYAAAEAALRAGVPVLVFPGGDHEAMRPLWQAGRVDFAGRKGFLKIARAAGVPIVPMGIRGSHHVAPVLWRSETILPTLFVFPRVMGIKRVPLTLAGVIGAVLLFALGPVVNVWVTAVLAWLWVALPVSRLPWLPARMRMRIGPAIAHERLFPGADDEEALQAAYTLTVEAVQDLVLRRDGGGAG